MTKAENTPSFHVDEHIRNFGKKSIRRKSNKILASSDAYRVRSGKNKMSSEEKEVIRKFETRRKQKNKKLRTEYSSNQDSECQ